MTAPQKRTLARLFVALASAGLLQGQGHKEILAELSAISGFVVKEVVAHETMKRAELKSYFAKRIDEVVEPEEIRIEELTLKKFGLVPSDFDLKKSTVDLMAEQAAAFYDYRKKKMVLLEADSSSMLEQVALVHELAHALADQHFPLERFLKKAGGSDDSSLARMAVMEGQAMYLMSEYMVRRMGQSLQDSPGMVDMMSRMGAAGSASFPVLESAPLYLRESLIFPYAAGMKFQFAVVRKLGKPGFEEVFKKAPLTTQQILHPELYLEGAIPDHPKPPKPARSKEWKVLADGNAGEFDHTILLRQYSQELELVASQWRGGSYSLLEHKKTKRVGLAYASRWADERAAGNFWKGYLSVLRKKWNNCEFTEQNGRVMAGKSEDGFFRAELDGAVVTSIEGMPAAEDTLRQK